MAVLIHLVLLSIITTLSNANRQHNYLRGRGSAAAAESPLSGTQSESHLIRLMDGTQPWIGRVHYYHNGQWGTVCDDSWDDLDAAVVCRQLGYHGGVALTDNEFGDGLGSIFLDEVQCTGVEHNLHECAHAGWNQHDCAHYEDAGVECTVEEEQTIEITDGKVRLVDGPTEYEGRVEIYHNGVWGTVCDDRWSHQNAMVVCDSLGYTHGLGLVDCEYGEGTGQIWLDEVDCSGYEVNLIRCDHAGWGVHDCGHNEDAGVKCKPKEGVSNENGVRLVGGVNEWEGRVEIYHDGVWGTVCDDYFDNDEAAVICRQLGFYGGQALTDCEFGEGTGQIWLDDLYCAGTEANLAECSGNSFGEHNCGHSEDAGVICEANAESGGNEVNIDAEGDVRLSGSPGSLLGRLEVFHEGHWGTVCDDNFDDTAAQVVCRQMGQGGAGSILHSYDHGQSDDLDIFLDEVSCTGLEERLTDCSSDGWGNHNCGHFEDVVISCQ